MVSLTLKNIPEPLLRELRQAADRDRRSLTQQIIHLLDSAVREPAAMPRLDIAAQVAAWRSLAGAWQSDVSPKIEVARLRKARRSRRKVEL